MSLTVMYSPAPRVGQTTVANYLANELGKHGMTLLIEFNNVTGRSLYMNYKTAERKKSLARVIYDISDSGLKENIIQSKYSSTMYFLCLNLYDNFMSIENYTPESLRRIIEEAKKDFDHIIIDLPSDLREGVTTTTLSRNFGHYIDSLLIVLDEDAQTYKRLNDLSSLLKSNNEEPKDVTYVINKTTFHYVDFIDDSLNLPQLRSKNIIKLESFDELVDCCNRGDMYGIGIVKGGRYLRSINTLREISMDGTIEGVGVPLSIVKKNIRDRALGDTPIADIDYDSKETVNTSFLSKLFKKRPKHEDVVGDDEEIPPAEGDTSGTKEVSRKSRKKAVKEKKKKVTKVKKSRKLDLIDEDDEVFLTKDQEKEIL